MIQKIRESEQNSELAEMQQALRMSFNQLPICSAQQIQLLARESGESDGVDADRKERSEKRSVSRISHAALRRFLRTLSDSTELAEREIKSALPREVGL